ncbi:MAG: oligogalacturonate lyase family protein [Ignavibacteriales bacterium]|nr:oligogalacturonate lyase family protein [Ignavibacteriales bacterium]
MKNSIIVSILILFSFSPTANIAQQNGIGKIWLSEKKTWIDDSTKYEITQWTTTGKNWHLYFNVESFIDENDAIIYSDRAGAINLFKLNLGNGTITQLTDNTTDVSGAAWHYPKLKQIWYEVDNSIRVLNYETLKNKLVIKNSSADLKSFTVTCDAKYLVFSVNKNPGYSSNNSTGPYAIMRFDLVTGDVKQISPDYGINISHLQASPTNPKIISYAWQHQYRKGGPGTVGNVPIRFFWINIDGTDGGPVGPQEFGIHRTHEFWFYDGSRFGYSARYMFGPNKGRQFLGSCKPDGSDNFMFEVPVGPAHSQVFKDNKHWVADQNNGMILTMWTFNRDKIIKEEKLFRHDSSWGEQPTHPHPHFSPDGKYIMLSTDKTGTPQVYTVKVNLRDDK